MGVNNKIESTSIIIADKVPLNKRVSVVKERISEWTDKLEENFDREKDEVRLNRYEKKGDRYFYQYIIVRGVNTLKRNLERANQAR
jgi:hypothetical protein